jgi:hypothetical protein
MANPVDADSKACICRYTYDVNELHVSFMEASLLSSLIVYAKQLHQPVMCVSYNCQRSVIILPRRPKLFLCLI